MLSPRPYGSWLTGIQKSGGLSETQLRRLLGFETRFQVHALLKEHRVPYRYSKADVQEDLATHRELGILVGR